MLKFIPLLIAGITRRKLRSVFTFASVVIAFMLYGMLAAVQNGFSAGAEVAGADRLMTTHKVSLIQPLPFSYLARIRAVSGVREVTHATWFGGRYQDRSEVIQVFPVEPESYLRIYSEYVMSKDDRARFLSDQSGAMVGRTLAKKYGWKVGDKVPLRSDFYRQTNGSDTWEFNISAIYDGNREGVDTQGVYFHYDYLEKSLSADMGRGQVGWYIVQIDVPERAADVGRAIDELFANSPAETKTATEKAFVQGFANQVGSIGAIVVFVASSVFFTMLLVTANTMAQSVRERRQEIGVLKTLGFADRSVLWLVVGESLVMTLSGGILGLVLALGLVESTGAFLSQYLSAYFLSTNAVMLGIGLAIGLGLISAALPASQALRLKIVDALRSD